MNTPIFTVSELAEIKLLRLHQQVWMVAKFARLQSVRLSWLGWGQCWKLSISCSQNPKQFPSLRMHCSRSGLLCCRNPLLKLWRLPQMTPSLSQLMDGILKIKY